MSVTCSSLCALTVTSTAYSGKRTPALLQPPCRIIFSPRTRPRNHCRGGGGADVGWGRLRRPIVEIIVCPCFCIEEATLVETLASPNRGDHPIPPSLNL